jgi:hypothetical protein
MAKSKEVVRVGKDGPSFLKQFVEEDKSVEALKEHRVLNRISVIQSNSPREIKDKFGEGSLAVPASEALVALKDASVEFVPVFFFDEFVTWSDRDDTASMMILDRSVDPASEVACKAKDFDLMFESYGPKVKDSDKLQFTKRHSHHLNFVGMLYSGTFKGTPVVITFSRSDFKKGKAFISAILMRKVDGEQAPLWSTRWKVFSEPRKNEKGEWYGLGFSNADDPWIEEGDAPYFKQMHEEMCAFHEASRLTVAHEAADVGDEEEEGKARF